MNEKQLLDHLSSYTEPQLSELFARAKGKVIRASHKSVKEKLKSLTQEELLPLEKELSRLSKYSLETDINLDFSILIEMALEDEPHYYPSKAKVTFNRKSKSPIETAIRDWISSVFDDYYADEIIQLKPFSKKADKQYKDLMALDGKICDLARKYDVSGDALYRQLWALQRKRKRSSRK